MIRVIVILALLFFSSCTQNEKMREKKLVELRNTVKDSLVNNKAMVGAIYIYNRKDTLSNHIDKIEILCLFFGEYYDNSFRIFLSNSKFNVVSTTDERNIIYIGSYEEKNKLIKYINQFYIDKTNQIVSSVESKKEQVETDYPFIRITGMNGKSQVLKKDITLRSDIKFTPEFIEFYEFLNSLVKKK